MARRSLSAEYITVSDERKAMGFDGDDLPNVDARAWYVAGTWALTGERKHGRLEPRNDLLRGGFGAVEVSARVEELRFGAASYPGSTFGFPTAGDLSTNADHAITVGINWYLNHYVKLQGNLVMESIDDPAAQPGACLGRPIRQPGAPAAVPFLRGVDDRTTSGFGRRSTAADRRPRRCGAPSANVALAQTQDDFFNDDVAAGGADRHEQPRLADAESARRPRTRTIPPI